jgi:hypothetical protein
MVAAHFLVELMVWAVSQADVLIEAEGLVGSYLREP